jgi:hypothetical protein
MDVSAVTRFRRRRAWLLLTLWLAGLSARSWSQSPLNDVHVVPTNAVQSVPHQVSFCPKWPGPHTLCSHRHRLHEPRY